QLPLSLAGRSFAGPDTGFIPPDCLRRTPAGSGQPGRASARARLCVAGSVHRAAALRWQGDESETRQSSSGIIYGVKILQTSGHMRTVNVDGQTGAILN